MLGSRSCGGAQRGARQARTTAVRCRGVSSAAGATMECGGGVRAGKEAWWGACMCGEVRTVPFIGSGRFALKPGERTGARMARGSARSADRRRGGVRWGAHWDTARGGRRLQGASVRVRPREARLVRCWRGGPSCRGRRWGDTRRACAHERDVAARRRFSFA
jgi:hypothetical protein